jgi:hypothetical protein
MLHIAGMCMWRVVKRQMLMWWHSPPSKPCRLHCMGRQGEQLVCEVHGHCRQRAGKGEKREKRKTAHEHWGGPAQTHATHAYIYYLALSLSLSLSHSLALSLSLSLSLSRSLAPSLSLSLSLYLSLPLSLSLSLWVVQHCLAQWLFGARAAHFVDDPGNFTIAGFCSLRRAGHKRLAWLAFGSRSYSVEGLVGIGAPDWGCASPLACAWPCLVFPVVWPRGGHDGSE